ncbi:hypothetical protein [Cryptosporangium phraense]|uniref:hypothetical protein n=1 Tax=Cryptosporangium phraense TaxID=2593070 RepID=UPI0014788E0A|nr:hypothetical protein [Cryptosporangium phraense]
MLIGLIDATELTRRVFKIRRVEDYVWWCTGMLSPSLQTIVDEVRAATGRAAATPL